jgi:hypothetical protein
MIIHLCMLKCSLLYYKRKSRELAGTLTEDDVLNMFRSELYDYCGSDDYTNNVAASGIPTPKVDPVATGISGINCTRVLELSMTKCTMKI